MIAAHVSSCILAALMTASYAFAAPLEVAGRATGFWDFLHGEVEPISIDVAGTLRSTGPLTVTLDFSKPVNERLITFDFDSRSIGSSVPVLLQAPLFAELGAPAQTLTVTLTGPIIIDPIEIPAGTEFLDVDLVFDIIAHGSGVFDEGQLLSGWRYSNIFNTVVVGSPGADVRDNSKIRIRDINTCDPKKGRPGKPPKGTTKGTSPRAFELPDDECINVDGFIVGTLTSPDGSQVIPITGTDIGRVQPVPGASVLLLMTAGTALLSIRRRSQRDK